MSLPARIEADRGGDASAAQLTRLLQAWSQGDDQALEALLPHVYSELRQLAAGALWAERSDHTLQPTALVHEAFLRLIDQRHVAWESRSHFFGIASRIIRRVLVDHARARGRAKRGRGLQVQLVEVGSPGRTEIVDLLAVDEALGRLADLDARQARIVELRFFAGLTIAETAEVIGRSPATVKREWTMARAWLAGQFDDVPNGAGDGR